MWLHSPVKVRTGFWLSAVASGLRAADRLRQFDTMIVNNTSSRQVFSQVFVWCLPEDADLSVVVSSCQKPTAGRKTLRENRHVEELQDTETSVQDSISCSRSPGLCPGVCCLSVCLIYQRPAMKDFVCVVTSLVRPLQLIRTRTRRTELVSPDHIEDTLKSCWLINCWWSWTWTQQELQEAESEPDRLKLLWAAALHTRLPDDL